MSIYIIPIVVIFLIIYASVKKIDCYTCFAQGAKKSFNLVFSVFPYIIAIMLCVCLFRMSGLSDFLIKCISPLFNLLGIPSEVCELVLLRPFSGSGSISLLSDLITKYGADSYIARCACTILGSSETLFYVSAIYFADSKLKNIAPAITISLIGNFVSAIFSCLFCKLF